MGRKRQVQIPGTERKHHQDVEKAAQAYVEVRDRRMELTKQEVDLHGKLVEAMKKHSLTIYRSDELESEVILTTSEAKEKAKVRRLDNPEYDAD